MSSWGTQFSTGDQCSQSRAAFSGGGYEICQQCGGKNVEKRSDVAGCRHNGDAYGTDVFTCQDCSWQTSFQWDDAANSYYYETEYFRNEEPFRPPSPHPLEQVVAARFAKLMKSLNGDANARTIVRSGLQMKGITDADIAKFFDDYDAGKY